MGDSILGLFDTSDTDPAYGTMPPPPVYNLMAGKPAQAGWTNAVAPSGRVPRAQIGHAAKPGWTGATVSPGRTPIAQIGRQPQPASMMPPGPTSQFMPQSPQPATQQPTLTSSSSGIIPEIDMHSRNLGEDRNGVKYLTDQDERVDKYWVRLGQNMTRRGTQFDTASIKKYFFDKSQDNNRPLKYGNQPAQLAIAQMRNGGSVHKAGDLMYEWAWNSLIWVLAVKPGSNTGQGALACFFSHVGKGGRFHHSSFMAGGKVICAGEWIVEAGRLRKISANSGHYRPPLGAFHRAVNAMASAWHADTEVLLWNDRTKTWEYVNVRVFVRDPTGGGKWKTNPDA
ncbi:MAG TPA: hypothetical protein VKU19_23220 [Bryobacteraceae bacterium]|nr:hypothetical protein [Bryobacteraceae bacterium]